MSSDRGMEEDEDPIREAASWFARMRGPEAGSSRQPFEAWLAADPAHRRAYNRASEIFAMGKLLAEPDGRPAAAPPAPPRRRLRLVAAAACVAAIAAAGWLALARPPIADGQAQGTTASTGSPASRMMLATIAGERRLVRLRDGSSVALGGDTRVQVVYNAGERRLSLLKGQARFDVFHEGRAFVVAAGGGTVTARGTLFDVALSPGREVVVRLIQGRVDVALPSTTGMAIRPLRAGERIAFAALRTGDAPAEPAKTSLQAGAGAATRDYDSVTLAELVAEANRGSPRPIFLLGAGLADRRVSGRFRVDDSALLAERLALLFDLEITRTDPERLILRPR
jgi:transmembrane sensor